jgi:hypothetical protein
MAKITIVNCSFSNFSSFEADFRWLNISISININRILSSLN